MPQPPRLSDRQALLRNRRRAALAAEPAVFLHEEAIIEIEERLASVNRSFTRPAIVTGFPEVWADVIPKALVVPDDDALALEAQAHDLVVHAMSLHWADDPVGQLAQARLALKPDGLLLAISFGGRTLQELRAALAEAEAQIAGGLSPRVAPMAEIRDLGAALQRAGFALPVADSLTRTVTYAHPINLMHDLRAMGEGNALASRRRSFSRREVLFRACDIYAEAYARPDGQIPATFEIITLTGWAPAPGQQQPLRPGSAKARLAEALGTFELPAGDPAGR